MNHWCPVKLSNLHNKGGHETSIFVIFSLPQQKNSDEQKYFFYRTANL